jgi:hypothetical protein
VYHSANMLLKKISLISINGLSDAKRNEYVTCFASRKTERRLLFNVLETGQILARSQPVSPDNRTPKMGCSGKDVVARKKGVTISIVTP